MTETEIANATYQGFLYGMHHEGYTASEAHAKLLKATGTEVFTLEQVKEHFEKIKSLAFTLKVDQSATEKPDILQLLAILPIREAFMAHCDLSVRLTLRAVSHTFKDIVEDSSLKLKKLSIGNDRRTGYIKADNFAWRYNQIQKGYVLSNGTRAILKKRDTFFMEHQQAHLKTILRLPKLEIDELRIYEDGENENDFNVSAFLLHEAAKGHEGLLNVRQLHFCNLDILPCCDPKQLEVFKLLGMGSVGTFRLENNLEHLRNLKELITSQLIETNNITEMYGHLEYMDFVLPWNTQMNSDELVILKDNFLFRPRLQKFEIIPSIVHNAGDPLFVVAPDGFLPFQDPYDKQWYHFKYPNSEERLSVKIAYDGILFKGPCYSGDKIAILRRSPIVDEEDDDDDGW